MYITAIVHTSVLEARDQSRPEDDVHIDVVLIGFAPESCKILRSLPMHGCVDCEVFLLRRCLESLLVQPMNNAAICTVIGEV
jgi:hypothetical protein